jgi:hypothetical protein
MPSKAPDDVEEIDSVALLRHAAEMFRNNGRQEPADVLEALADAVAYDFGSPHALYEPREPSDPQRGLMQRLRAPAAAYRECPVRC